MVQAIQTEMKRYLLWVLGFVRKASEKLSKIVKEDPEASVESIIKKALKKTYKRIRDLELYA
jgi:Holliday junction resolvasome RuvABC DNA-binding subunit